MCIAEAGDPFSGKAPYIGNAELPPTSLLSFLRSMGESPFCILRHTKGPMLTIFIDADACPVKDEIYRVARRYAIPVVVVANTTLSVPRDPLIQLVVPTGARFNIVDDWITERAGLGDIV